MKKFFTLTLSLLIMFMFTACSGDNDKKNSEVPKSETSSAENVDSAKSDNKILIVYFSRTGDNYEVGEIDKGNTHIVADMIADKVNADIFEIKPVNEYPADYTKCTEVAKEELQVGARPKYVGKVENFDQYDTIFLGYPIWWSDLPMIVYTFLEDESYDFKGKTIIPFCTSAGTYMTGKENAIPDSAHGASMREGIGIKGKLCQDSPDDVRADVDKWLGELGY